MNRHRKVAAFGGLLALAAFGVLVTPRGVAGGGQNEAKSNEPTPAYHSQVPAGTLPQTMDPSSLQNPVVQNAYVLAAKVKRILYQQPCYCHCDRSIGHQSLLDCFVSKHASVCDVCVREGIYAYEQTQKKKTAAQIRAGIERGEWQQVDLSKYETAPSRP